MNYLDILIYALIAAFLFSRLWSVLGQKNEGDDDEGVKRQNPFSSREAQSGDDEDVMVLEGRARAVDPGSFLAPVHAPASLAGALEVIRKADPSFEEKKFLDGAKLAFRQIVQAFANGNLEPVSWLLGPEVSRPFDAAIKGRADAGETLENKIERIAAADIVAAKLEGTTAFVSVEFVSHQVNVIKDKNGAVVDGRPGQAEEVRDIWVFSRDMKSENPNWKLVETKS